MIEQNDITHHVQKHIISVLLSMKYARFRDLKPPNIDTNLYSYHLKILQQRHFIIKMDEGYTLDKKGILYVDRVSTSTLKVRTQPKIIMMLVVQNSEGDILLYRRLRRPFTNQWTLPNGKLHIEDETLVDGAKREAYEKLFISDIDPRHVGDCYIRIKDKDETIMSTLVHVFRFEYDSIEITENMQWARPHKLNSYDLAPAVEKIVTRSFFNDPFFFEEFYERW